MRSWRSLAFRAARRLCGRSAEQRLKRLLRWSDLLDRIVDEEAIAYESERSARRVHPKHRLTRYHDFFAARITAGESVLDVGCGVGAVAATIARQCGASVTGVDINAADVRTAAETWCTAGLRFAVCDATRELPAARYDVVVLSNILEHIADRRGFLCSILERAHPRRILIRVPLYERDWRVPLREELGLPYFSDPTHHTEYTPESFRAEMAAVPLAVRAMEIRWGEIWAEVVPAGSERAGG